MSDISIASRSTSRIPAVMHQRPPAMSCFIPAVSASLAPRATSRPISSRSALRMTTFCPKRPRVALKPRVAPSQPATPGTTTRMQLPQQALSSIAPLLLAEISDVNKGPLFATSFVFFLTFWGGISFVKGSTKSRVTQASFTLREPSASIAKKTARYLMQRSFVADPEKDSREGVMTFTGNVRASTSVASILVAVGASALWSAAYILNFVLPENLQSPYYGWLSLLSVLVVPWYWKQASRTEEVKVMVEEEDDEMSTLYLKGHRDEIEELERAFQWKRNAPVYEGDDEAKNKQPEPVSSGK